MAAVIETQGLTKRYGREVAVEGLSFQVDEGDIYGFLGPNGAGKTTTLLMLLGLTQPTSGTVRVMGFDPVREPLEVKRVVGYLPENMGFYGDMSAWENLAYVARLNGLYAQAVRGRVEAALDTVGLLTEKDKRVEAYSRGMRQRLGLAELLVKEPKVVFLDEPTLGLDPDGVNRILDLILALNRNQGISVLLSSHLLNQVQRVCNRVGIMSKGALVAQGSIAELGKSTFGEGAEEFNLEQIYMRYSQEA